MWGAREALDTRLAACVVSGHFMDSTPKTVDEIMPVARRLVREAQGLQGGGLGVARPGDTVALITNIASEDIYVEAIKRAYQERGITALSMPDYALVGLTREQAQKAREAIRPFTGKDGAAAEIRLWIENMFPKPDETKAWLKANHPEVYAAVYPDQELDATQKELINKMRSTNIGDAIRKFLDQHPEVRGVFWAKAGDERTPARRIGSRPNPSERENARVRSSLPRAWAENSALSRKLNILNLP